MADTSAGASSSGPSTPATTSPSSTAARTRPTKPSGLARLESDKGTTTISDVVVTKVAGIAAREVSGVHRLGGSVARALGAMTQRLSVGDGASTQGVSVEVSDHETTIQVVVIIDYGESIQDVAQEIRDNVIRRIEGTTGLTVTAVDVAVNDLYFPGDDDDDDAATA